MLPSMQGPQLGASQVREIEVVQPRIQISKELKNKLESLNLTSPLPPNVKRTGSSAVKTLGTGYNSEVGYIDTEAAKNALRRNHNRK